MDYSVRIEKINIKSFKLLFGLLIKQTQTQKKPFSSTEKVLKTSFKK